MPELLDKAKEIVPSSYYDLIARVVPGCVAIVAVAWVFPAIEVWPKSATDVLLMLGAGYVVGVWLSSISTLLLLPLLWIPSLYTYSGHPGIEWITHVEAAYGKAEKDTRPCRRLSRFPTGPAAAASR